MTTSNEAIGLNPACPEGCKGRLARTSSRLLSDVPHRLRRRSSPRPAALENAVTEENAHTIHARIVSEAANGPVTPEADRIFNSKGIFLIPDILCNAGGVTVSYFEWVQDENHLFWDEQDVNAKLEKIMKRSFADVLKIHLDKKVDMRLAANMLGVSRVAEACKVRGLYP